MSALHDLQRRQREIVRELASISRIINFLTDQQKEHYEKLADELETIERKLEKR